jgi:adenylate cyclase
VIPALTWYNAACSYALAGDKEKAIDLLTRAFGTGRITNRDHVRADADLASLKDDPRFAALVTRAAP